MMRPVASVSLDLDNKWSYLKTHGDRTWIRLPSFLDVVIPRMVATLGDAGVPATFFAVGLDATRRESRDLIRGIVEAGHELGNHSHRHDPWLHRYTDMQVAEEIGRAHEALVDAAGVEPTGFRGPGYSLSGPTLRALRARGYRYDSSTLPTWIGPLARAYYFRTAQFTDSEREERAALFGGMADTFRPLRPYRWGVEEGGLVEMPVTTMPMLRLPIHFTYLMQLDAVRPALARGYFRLALRWCRRRGIDPLLLLHPLEFLDRADDVDGELGFLPGMNAPWGHKRELLLGCLEQLCHGFDVIPLADRARRYEIEPLPVRVPGPREVVR